MVSTGCPCCKNCASVLLEVVCRWLERSHYWHTCVQSKIQTKNQSARSTALKSHEDGNEDYDEDLNNGRGAKAASTSRSVSSSQPGRQVSGSKWEAAKKAASQTSEVVSAFCPRRKISASVLLDIFLVTCALFDTSFVCREKFKNTNGVLIVIVKKRWWRWRWRRRWRQPGSLFDTRFALFDTCFVRRENFRGLETQNGGASGWSFPWSWECSDWLGQVLWSLVLQNRRKAAMNPYFSNTWDITSKAECMCRMYDVCAGTHVPARQFMLVRFLTVRSCLWVSWNCVWCAELCCLRVCCGGRMQNQLGIFFILAMTLPSDCEL